VFAIAPAGGPAFILDSLRHITTPTAIVAGRADSTAPIRSNAQRLGRTIPKARLTLLPAVGHYTFLATCTEAGRAAQPQLCADAPGVDRDVVHEGVATRAAQFFDEALK